MLRKFLVPVPLAAVALSTSHAQMSASTDSSLVAKCSVVVGGTSGTVQLPTSVSVKHDTVRWLAGGQESSAEPVLTFAIDDRSSFQVEVQALDDTGLPICSATVSIESKPLPQVTYVDPQPPLTPEASARRSEALEIAGTVAELSYLYQEVDYLKAVNSASQYITWTPSTYVKVP